MRDFNYTATIAIKSRKQALAEEIDKLKSRIEEFDMDRPVISMITINMAIQEMNRLAISISAIENVDGLHTTFTTDPIYGVKRVDTIPVPA